MSNFDCDRLQEIAQHFTGRSDIVVEECADLPGAWAEASHDFRRPIIRLRSDLANDATWLLEVFAHEIAHHRRGHIPDLEPHRDFWSVTRNLVKATVRNAVIDKDRRETEAIETGATLESQIQQFCKNEYGRTFGMSVIRW